MSTDGSSWAPTPRQYRPTFSTLPSSISTSNIGSSFPRPTKTPELNTKRRRTTSTFPLIDHLHSAPTVASSGLTASVFSNDISNPTPKLHRLSIHPRTKTPTRIPTPVPQINVFSPVRSVSSPAAPQKYKENLYPTTTHRLLGPIPPGPPPHKTLTKSRTMNVLSTFTSTFTRSTHSLSSSRSSLGSFSSTQHTAVTTSPPRVFSFSSSTTSTSCLPLPVSSSANSSSSPTNPHQIRTPMPPTYWLGRHQALHDLLLTDHLSATTTSAASFLASPSKQHQHHYFPSLSVSSAFSTPDPDHHHDPASCSSSSSTTRKNAHVTNAKNADDNDPNSRHNQHRLSHHIFTHLASLCATPEAHRSLKAFQLAYARKVACEALCPLGTSLAVETGRKRKGLLGMGMVGGEEGFIVRAGRRLFSGSSVGGGKSGGSGGGGGGLERGGERREGGGDWGGRKGSGSSGLSLGFGEVGGENTTAGCA